MSQSSESSFTPSISDVSYYRASSGSATPPRTVVSSSTTTTHQNLQRTRTITRVNMSVAEYHKIQGQRVIYDNDAGKSVDQIIQDCKSHDSAHEFSKEIPDEHYCNEYECTYTVFDGNVVYRNTGSHQFHLPYNARTKANVMYNVAKGVQQWLLGQPNLSSRKAQLHFVFGGREM
ncbi:hypothetical protein BC835DRAFT_406885 [Cytidiella melzeri]|nr:hypothetical protein BC835DRAFT_406885 [Cytidiella melzeri]